MGARRTYKYTRTRPHDHDCSLLVALALVRNPRSPVGQQRVLVRALPETLEG